MAVLGCYGAVLSILLFLFCVNSVLVTFCIHCVATEYVVSFCTVVCLYNMLDFCKKYFKLPLFSH